MHRLSRSLPTCHDCVLGCCIYYGLPLRLTFNAVLPSFNLDVARHGGTHSYPWPSHLSQGRRGPIHTEGNRYSFNTAEDGISVVTETHVTDPSVATINQVSGTCSDRFADHTIVPCILGLCTGITLRLVLYQEQRSLVDTSSTVGVLTHDCKRRNF